MIDLPRLEPTMRTVATARLVRALDRSAARLLWVLWWAINHGLHGLVRLVIMLDRERSRWSAQAFDERGNFTCCWCLSVTPEFSRLPLSCCYLAYLEWLRGHDPAAYENRTRWRPAPDFY